MVVETGLTFQPFGKVGIRSTAEAIPGVPLDFDRSSSKIANAFQVAYDQGITPFAAANPAL